MSNPDAIDLDIDPAHESDETPTNDIDNDIDVAAQMGFSSFGGPPKATYHYKEKGKKRSRDGDAGGVATGANMSWLKSGSQDGSINAASGSNVVTAEEIKILPPPTDWAPDSLSQSLRASQKQIPGLPAKPEFTGVPTGEYIRDTLEHGHEQGQGDYWQHRSGHDGRGRGRGRSRGGRGGGGGEDVGNAMEGYYLPSFVEDPWARLRTSIPAPYEG
ncbi:hypothetical protein EV426DRAFT_574527 [Tirmania nivea]|nr:hypothetical protein EV426DRAFT_574527 [Tirmania nivea]